MYLSNRLSSSVRGDFTAPAQVAELYIDLLCRYNCTGVVEFLKTNENYRVDETLKVKHISTTYFRFSVHLVYRLYASTRY